MSLAGYTRVGEHMITLATVRQSTVERVLPVGVLSLGIILGGCVLVGINVAAWEPLLLFGDVVAATVGFGLTLIVFRGQLPGVSSIGGAPSIVAGLSIPLVIISGVVLVPDAGMSSAASLAVAVVLGAANAKGTLNWTVARDARRKSP